ncbi:hypothetical protein H0H87_002563 [Tephrocybe sp. NHM501043]|nr:hypothetical protein H0H87_002563 [Tephrocybe sp. NHM501043]
MHVAIYSALALAATATARAFNPLQHSGPASPYFDAPSQFGIPSPTPANCHVDQAAYILRHGSRYPEPGSFAGWQALYTKFQNATYTARGPLAFIPSWVPPVDDVPHQPLFLTSTGAAEAFSLGADLRKRYAFTKGGENMTVWAASQQRCVDTASFFLRGYLSQGNYLAAPALNRGRIIALPDSVNDTFANSLTPSAACPNYNAGSTGATASSNYRALYQTKIADRLNGFLDGLTLGASDIGVMQDLCGFLAEVDGDTRFCDVFEESEWLNYEYAHDLNYYYGSGPGNPTAATTGYPWVKAISNLFAAGPGNSINGGTMTPPPLIMGFTHDNNLPPVVAALGLWNSSSASRNVYPLSLTRPNPARTFRSSYLVAFRGYVALERLSCSRNGNNGGAVKHTANQLPITGATDAYVRVRINNAPVPIPGCASGPGAMCPLDKFTSYVKERGAAAGDFVAVCGLENVANATSVVSFLTEEPEAGDVQLVSL